MHPQHTKTTTKTGSNQLQSDEAVNAISNPDLKKIVDEANSAYSRKQFLKTAGSVALFAALGISLSSCEESTGTSVIGPENGSGNGDLGNGSGNGITISGNTIRLDLSNDNLSHLRSAGGWDLIIAAQTLVVNIDGETIRAFTSICTHSACDRNWEYQNELFTCTCHGSRFSNTGSVVQGPATRDLQEFTVTRDGNSVTIEK